MEKVLSIIKLEEEERKRKSPPGGYYISSAADQESPASDLDSNLEREAKESWESFFEPQKYKLQGHPVPIKIEEQEDPQVPAVGEHQDPPNPLVPPIVPPLAVQVKAAQAPGAAKSRKILPERAQLSPRYQRLVDLAKKQEEEHPDLADGYLEEPEDREPKKIKTEPKSEDLMSSY